MSNKKVVHCTAFAFLCGVIFFVTYYGGLFYSVRIFLTVYGVVTSLLLISYDFNVWGVKCGMYAIGVMVLMGIFQQINLYNVVGEKLLNINMNKHLWGESLVISNCLWFGVLFGSVLFALGVTAIRVYRRSK